MEEQLKIDIYSFYKCLWEKVKQEELRLKVYREEAKTVVASLEPDRAVKIKLALHNQVNFLETLYQVQKELTNQLLLFAKTFNELEALVFVRCVMQKEDYKKVAEETGKSSKYIHNIKQRLIKDMNSRIIIGQI